jgi:hypothetical protein
MMWTDLVIPTFKTKILLDQMYIVRLLMNKYWPKVLFYFTNVSPPLKCHLDLHDVYVIADSCLIENAPIFTDYVR